MVQTSNGRFRPQHPLRGAFGSVLARPLAEQFFRHKQIYRAGSALAAKRRRELRTLLARGETTYLAGIGMGGYHNSGVALVEVTPDGGPRIICNNEEERFSGRKHANHCPDAALAALREMRHFHASEFVKSGGRELPKACATFKFKAGARPPLSVKRPR